MASWTNLPKARHKANPSARAATVKPVRDSHVTSKAVSVLTGSIGAVLGALADLSQLHPSFMAFEPLGPGRYWIVGAWLPFFALNILGEEFVWRAFMLPRQEVAFGGKAWLVNAVLWLLFHAAFPWQTRRM